MHMAIQQRRMKCATMLLDARANPNARNSRLSTPLMVAAASAPALVKLLLESKADPDVVNATKATAYDVANELGHTEIASLLAPLTARHVATDAPSADGRFCHICGEKIHLYKLQLIKRRGDAGEEDNQHVRDFVASKAYGSLITEARFHRAINAKALRKEVTESWGVVVGIQKVMARANIMPTDPVCFVDL